MNVATVITILNINLLLHRHRIWFYNAKWKMVLFWLHLNYEKQTLGNLTRETWREKTWRENLTRETWREKPDKRNLTRETWRTPNAWNVTLLSVSAVHRSFYISISKSVNLGSQWCHWWKNKLFEALFRFPWWIHCGK